MHDANVRGLDLNLLTALDALLRSGSVTGAAGELGLSQPAMSHRLRRLRALFGDPLVVPGKRGLVPTPRALQLAGPLRSALRGLAAVVEVDAPFDPATVVRTFHVCSSDLGDLCAMPLVLDRLSREAPGVSIVARLPWPGMYEALERGEIDLIMAGGFPGDLPGLVQRKVAEDAWECLARVGHPKIRGRLTLKTYIALSHILISPRGSGPGVVDDLLAARGLSRRIGYRTPHFLGAPHIVASSDLVVTTNRSLARRMAEVLPLQRLAPPLPMPPSTVRLGFHARMQADAGHRWLRELAAECTREGFADVASPASPA